jgi:signal transduction histidine kinase
MADLNRSELPSTAERPAIKPVKTGRPFGVRLWLALMFAAIGILSGTSVYLFVSESSDSAAQERSESLTAAKTDTLARQVEAGLRGIKAPDPDEDELRKAVGPTLATVRSESFRAWYFDSEKGRVGGPEVTDVGFSAVPGGDEARSSALEGEGVFNADLPDDRIVVSTPIFGGTQTGALVVLADRPPEVASALQSLQEERLTALAVAVVVAALIGFLVASLITTRIKRLADAAGRIAEGDLNEPMQASGRDEIGDLGRALDAMRIALAESFEALSSERDRLSAIFVSLEDAVIVVGADGDVRFANPAASDFIRPDGTPIGALLPWVRRASHRGAAESDHVTLENHVVAIGARNLPAEGAVLLVVRDRTEELRRDQAEREFVSNAAHELRNPIAGMSGAIEVLRSGAKDDPDAREHFLERLAADVDRVSRLTKSLLTLARMEAIGEGEADVVSVEMAIAESAATVEAPDGIELNVETEEELVAEADPVLLRQVLIGLLTNAYKHTVPPGAVNLRARREDSSVVIEVEDTGAGIPAEERDRVFERFYRGSGSLEREGFGLGLAIAKRMIDVMGGEITVSSEEGKGSTFTIRLGQAVPSPTPVA